MDTYTSKNSKKKTRKTRNNRKIENTLANVEFVGEACGPC